MKASLKMDTAKHSEARSYFDLSSSEQASPAKMSLGKNSLSQVRARPPVTSYVDKVSNQQNHSTTIISDNYIGEGLKSRAGRSNISSAQNVSTIGGDTQHLYRDLPNYHMSTIGSLAVNKPMLGNFTTVQPADCRNSTSGLYHASLSPVRKAEAGSKHNIKGKLRGASGKGSTTLLNTSSLMHYG